MVVSEKLSHILLPASNEQTHLQRVDSDVESSVVPGLREEQF